MSFQQVARNQTKSFEDHPPRNKGTFVSERVSRYEAEQKLKAIQTKQEQVQKRRLEIVHKKEELLKRSACVSTLFLSCLMFGCIVVVFMKKREFCLNPLFLSSLRWISETLKHLFVFLQFIFESFHLYYHMKRIV